MWENSLTGCYGDDWMDVHVYTFDLENKTSIIWPVDVACFVSHRFNECKSMPTPTHFKDWLNEYVGRSTRGEYTSNISWVNKHIDVIINNPLFNSSL